MGPQVTEVIRRVLERYLDISDAPRVSFEDVQALAFEYDSEVPAAIYDCFQDFVQMPEEGVGGERLRIERLAIALARQEFTRTELPVQTLTVLLKVFLVCDRWDQEELKHLLSFPWIEAQQRFLVFTQKLKDAVILTESVMHTNEDGYSPESQLKVLKRHLSRLSEDLICGVVHEAGQNT